MKKLALVSVSIVSLAPVSLVGIAGAQTPPAKGAPAVPAAEKKAPPPAADAKKPAPPADKAAPPAEKAAAEKMAPPKPPEAPAELADMAKNMAGSWKCTGQAELGGQMMDVKATITHKVDPNLNKFWINTSFTGTAGKLPPFKFFGYTTYDATAKKLWRVNVNGRGGHGWAWGTMADKKVTWEGEARWPGGVDVKVRESEEMVSPKEVKVLGEYSKDGGKTWSKDHEASCKK
jgi:hypothetical protein